MELIKRLKRVGPKILPWGTELLIGWEVEWAISEREEENFQSQEFGNISGG